MNMNKYLDVNPEVAAAIAAGKPVVALESTAKAGLAAGSIAMESPETINPQMSAQALRSRMG